MPAKVTDEGMVEALVAAVKTMLEGAVNGRAVSAAAIAIVKAESDTASTWTTIAILWMEEVGEVMTAVVAVVTAVIGASAAVTRQTVV